VIERIKAARPDMALSGDFIVGFPGETDQDFEDTLTIIREVGYASAYSFKYSTRPGTPGANLGDQVARGGQDRTPLSPAGTGQCSRLPPSTQSCVGKTLPVLIERAGSHAGAGGRTLALSAGRASGWPTTDLIGAIHQVEIIGTPAPIR
jgi:tRNA-2-methylthio-N6-dimethylallyladenosine synthase